ncbi:MAG: hypothetical protein EA357_03845 [Micavibrio sp.]|nr:MAG: hypothetical protein EA357_03845 [Micavibrio sp.]
MLGLKQAKLIRALSGTAWMWLGISVLLFFYFDNFTPLSAAGGAYIATGLLLLIEIFGVFNFLMRKFFLKRIMQAMRRGRRNYALSREDLLRINIGVNLFWLVPMFLCCYYIAGLYVTLFQ